MLSKNLNFMLVAIVAIINQTSAAALLPKVWDEKAQNTNQFVGELENAIASDDEMEKRHSDQQLINWKANNYELDAIKKLLRDMYVGKRDSGFQPQNIEDAVVEGRNNPKTKSAVKGFARFIIDFDDDTIIK